MGFNKIKNKKKKHKLLRRSDRLVDGWMDEDLGKEQNDFSRGLFIPWKIGKFQPKSGSSKRSFYRPLFLFYTFTSMQTERGKVYDFTHLL